jgi:hypothetical protein
MKRRPFEGYIKFLIQTYGSQVSYETLSLQDKCYLKAHWLENCDMDISTECDDPSFKRAIISFLKNSSSSETQQELFHAIFNAFTKSEKLLEKYIEDMKEEHHA